MSTSNNTSQQVKSLLEELRSMASEDHREGMERFGIRVDKAFGISIYELQKIAKRLGRDHDLALALWATENHEARLLACFIDEPAKIQDDQLEAWALAFDSWDLCDQATTSLFDQTEHAWKKAVQWSYRNEEFVKRAGFSLMAGLAVHDKEADDKAFLALLPHIERCSGDDRNFVRKAVNWALRNIGKRNEALRKAAIACAERIRKEANQKAGGERGGDASVKAARWIAADALRELQSEKVAARVKKKGARA